MKFADFGVIEHRFTTAAGIRVLLFERPGQPVSIAASFASGSRFDPIKKEGLAHIVEHMLVAGTEKFPSKDQLAIYIERLGGVFGASTARELLTINLVVGDPTDTAKAVELLDQMLNHSLFREATFDNEIGSVLRELGNRESNPSNYVTELWHPLLFPETPVSRSVLGTDATIHAVTIKDVETFYEQFLSSNRLGLVVAGGISPEQLTKLLDTRLTMRRDARPRDTQIQPLRQSTSDRRLATHRFQINDQIDFVFGCRTVPYGHPDYASFDILNTIVGKSRSGTLTRILRYEHGLVYSIASGHLQLLDCGSWMIKTATGKKDFPKVLQLIVQEFDRLRSGGMTAAELAFAKEKISKSQRMQLQDSSSWVSFHSQEFTLAPQSTWNLLTYLDDIRRVSLADIHRICQTYLQPDNYFVVACGDILENEVSLPW